MYFSFDGDNLQFHDTAEAAEKEARDAFEEAKDYAADYGWSDESMDICWGEVKQTVKVTAERRADPEEGDSNDFTTIQERELVDVEEE